MKNTPGGLPPVIAVGRKAAQPLHWQIYDAYRAAIIGRNLQPGQRVPSSRSLALELGISRIPVLTAYAQLMAEGYFESRVGAGTYVSGSLPEQWMSCEGAGETACRTFPAIKSGALPWTYGSGAFSVGQLAFAHFPFQVWSNLVARHARKVRAGDLNYGDPMGSQDFRETIATYLRTSRAVDCDAGQIMVVSGSQQALDISARVLVEPGNPVWVEEPGYELMREALTLAGCRLIPVPVDGEGLRVAAGIKLCRQARAAFVTPSHQYPLGVTMSAARRLELLDWARKSGAWIVEDDYDSEYRYESMPIASLQGIDRGARVIYIGTFSKTLFPSLRLGYMVIPHVLAARFAAVRRAMDLCPPHLSQAVLTDFMDQGHYARHIRKTRLLYGERRSALVAAIGKEFGGRLEILGGEAGMHLTVALPPGLRDREISERAAAERLWLWPLSSAYMGKAARQGFILGFGSTQAADMPKAVRRLRDVLGSG
ncbi:MAG: PLP-dependent aminotransferase family protein [Bryobacteraceae bacterium]|jgi:GntR family transcriptional regulator/MocR family aminotransferase